jgi:hypothetical protein
MTILPFSFFFSFSFLFLFISHLYFPSPYPPHAARPNDTASAPTPVTTFLNVQATLPNIIDVLRS